MGSFNKNTNFTYHIKEGAYTSHIAGNASVYFYPRPKVTNKTQIVGWNEESQLKINLEDGFTHLLNDGASIWSQVSGSPDGILSNWACSGTQCTVDYTPTSNTYSTSGSDFKTFNYKVVHAAAHGSVDSEPASGGTFNIEVFPTPVASNKTLYWVQGQGDPNKSAATAFNVTVSLNQEYTHALSKNPNSIIVTNVTGGAFETAFSCVGSTCTGKFVPSEISTSNADKAASFNYSVVIDGYEAFPSNTALAF